MLGFGAGVDDAGHAGRGAHGGPGLAHEGVVELGEEVAREQRLGGLLWAGECGVEALKSAALQAVEGQGFLAGFGANQIPLFHSFIVVICICFRPFGVPLLRLFTCCFG